MEHDRAFETGLDAFARRVLGGPIAHLRRLTGGASQQLWSFDVGDRGYVLRRAPGGAMFDKMGTIAPETEAAVIGAVAAQGVPVAPVAAVLTPDDGLGRGFVSVRMPGEALGKRIVADPRFAGIRDGLAHRCGAILSAIHATPPASLPPLPVRSPARSLDQLEGQLRSFGEPRPVFEAALAWLRDRCPPATVPQLVHGDFRNGNFLLEPDRLVAVLDWEACHLGDPVDDLGWLCMPSWRFGRPDLPVGGFGTRERLLAGYGRAVDPARLRFWEVRGILRWGLTCMAMAEAFLNGDRSIERAAVGRRASEAELDLLHAMTEGA
ncbi:hypothetical protein ASG29_04240 [Sphingomonas sp. Leaf412]|uniref:phosphotransferase family protein n=1 Tax=Sphingomonas sp. Leaf412 TaxID=1736370 RepID=UPI0006FC1D96|nr:phosphotransferase family protein [Sphingomonas sp. Leaf412]KQT35313.1 hypothetical protein ASG29_04240 [Sphingomonas sp. Leaf412]